MRIHTTDAEIIERLRLIREHGTVWAAAKAASIHADTLRKAQAYGKQRGLTADSQVRDEKERLRSEVERLTSEMEAMQKRVDDDADIRKVIFDLASRSPEPPKWLSSSRGKNGFIGAPMTMWSDWHYGEVVRPDEVSGLNDFNSEVAKARVKRLVDTTADLCFHHMGNTKTVYPGIVVCVNGDIMTGDIHQELNETNDRTPQAQVNDLTDIIIGAIENLAVKFGNVCVFWTVGNHGRGTMKPRMKARVRTSYEWVIGCNVERYFRKNKHVRIIVPVETDVHFRVYGQRFLQSHGDSLGTKGGDGIIGAIGPIMRGAMKVGRSESQVGRDFDWLLLGHWHQMLWLPGCIVNNALKGYDEFARLALRAPYSRPSQALWFVNPEHGLTARWEIYLEGLLQAQETMQWVSWQQAAE
jgi:hypothetical protein